MVARWPGAFLVSTFLHGAIIAVIVLVGWAVVEPQPPARILSFVGAVGAVAETRAPVSSTTGLRVTLPPALTPHATAEPAASAAPDETMTATPERPKAATAARGGVAAPRRAPSVASSPRRITKADFDARQGNRTMPAAATPRAARRYVDGTRLADELKAEAGASMRGNGAIGSAVPGADSYLGRLEAALGAAIERHPGLLDGLTAVAEYHILADGRLTRVRLITPSGDAEFDSVLVSTIEGYEAGPRPADVPEVYRTRFHTRAR